MADFYAQWLKKNKSDNKQILSWLEEKNSTQDDPQLQNEDSPSQDEPSGATNDEPSGAPATEDEPSGAPATEDEDSDLTSISYQSENYRIVIRQEKHRRQKNFRLEDLLYTLKVIPLHDELPYLLDIIPFLEEWFNVLLKKLKKFFSPHEHRIAYLTLYQAPMVNDIIQQTFK